MAGMRSGLLGMNFRDEVTLKNIENSSRHDLYICELI